MHSVRIFQNLFRLEKSLFAKFSIHKNQSTVQDFFKIVFLLKTGLNFLSVKTNSTVYDFFINFFCFLKKAGKLFYLKNKSSKIITIFSSHIDKGEIFQSTLTDFYTVKIILVVILLFLSLNIEYVNVIFGRNIGYHCDAQKNVM